MRILFFIDNLMSGGKERRFVELLKGLKAYPSIEFEIVLMNENIHYKEILTLHTKIHFLERRIKKDLSVFKKFYKICKEYRPGMIHTWDDMTTIISIPTCKLLNIKLINGMVADTPVTRNFLNKTWLRAKFTFPFSDKIIGNSKAGLIGYSAPSKKCTCIYNGMDFNRFKTLNDPNVLRREIFSDSNISDFIVGMVAAFEPRKDFKTFIKGAVSLVQSNKSIRFILVGDGSDFTKMKNIVPIDLASKIVFLGKRNDVESIVNLFDVGVLLTNSKVHGEGISNSLIEYMALSKPVIATKGGGTNEIVFDNKNGFLIDSGDSCQFVECVEKLIKSKELGKKMGKAGNQIVHDSFDVKIMTENYISIYQSLLEHNKN